MSIATSNRVWTQSKHAASALLVLLALADRADDDGYCWPGMEDIATRTRMDKRQAQRTIKLLEESGELHAQRFGGRGRSNEYIVTTGQEAQQIANTLVRRFNMDTTAATTAAQQIIQRQIKGDIQGQKVTPEPPFIDTIKGDIHGEKVVQKPRFTRRKGDIHGEKVTSTARKGDTSTTRIIINQKEKEDILLSSPQIDFLSAENAEENTPDHIGQGDEARLAKAQGLWQTAINEMALSLPAPTFEQWVRDTDVLSYTDGEFAIGVPHAYARDWLQNRLRPQIKRILGRLLQRSIEVTFAVRPRKET